MEFDFMPDLSNSRILIVDDVKANVDVLVHLLREDYKLSVALGGEAALKAAEKLPPDLVLLDIVMPGIDGYEVCRRLRANPATAEVPVMFLSALDEVRSKALGFEAGGNDYLTKPFEALEVKARVHSLLKAKAYSDAVKQKIASELRIASEIQMGMLRHDVQEIVDGTGLRAAAIMEPAREVGGDFYDIIRAGADRVVVVVGDVSGKGVPAALFMAVSTTLARVIGRDHDCPGRILTLVNNALVEQNPQTMFVTMACAVIDTTRGNIRYSSGGHPSPVLLRPGNEPRLPFDSSGPMVGVFPEVLYTSEEHPFQSGDGYVFYTDGVTEAMNSAGELFGNDRLLASFRGDRPPLDAVLDAVRAHAAGHPQSDDITIVAISRS